MTTTQHDLEVKKDGSIFQIDHAYYTRSTPPGPRGSFTLVVHNRSGEWIDVNVDRNDAFGGTAITGHIQNGEDGGYTEPAQMYVATWTWDQPAKVTRWRPGFLRIPGNGGGEIFFIWPQGAESVVLEITVTG
jgi:hypothetical protein